LFVTSLVLGACGNASNQKPQPQTNLPALEVAPTPGTVVEVNEPEVTETEPEVASIEPEPEPIIVNDDPQQFVSLNIHELSKLLGAPNLVRRDGNAEVWQYQASQCTLDIFLYEDNANLQVKYVDLRGDADDAGNRQCMADILRQHILQMS